MTLSPGVLGDGHRLAGHQRLVDGGLAVFDEPVDGDLLAGADPEQVADLDLVEGDVLFGAVVADAARGLGGEVEQGLDGAGGRLAGAELEDLAEQDEGGDDGGGLEVHVDGAVHHGTRRGRCRARRWRRR